jgi:structure-specific endonuclease subunit SLX1
VPWFAYVLVSERSRRTYVGSTTDVARRTRQHNGELRGGARATRAHRPWRIARVFGPFTGRGEALRAELRIKKVRGLGRVSVVLRLERGRGG